MAGVSEELRRAVEAAADRPDVTAAVGRVYADIQAAVDARRPVCTASGRCCKFEVHGHRLYVSTLELAAFMKALPVDGELPGGKGVSALSTASWDGTGCPYQVDGLCSVHPIRPFGCRMYFCDPTSTQWQNEAYEGFHARLKRLHDELKVPYFYVEWRAALAALALTPAVGAGGPHGSHPLPILTSGPGRR
jgi:Fe-S-cluster containining protein